MQQAGEGLPALSCGPRVRTYLWLWELVEEGVREATIDVGA